MYLFAPRFPRHYRIPSRLVAVGLALGLLPVAAAKTWEIPFGGNAYVTKLGADGGKDQGKLISPDGVVSLYFRVDRATELDLALWAQVPQGESRIRATVAGRTFETDLKSAEPADLPLGRIAVKAAGYVKVDLQGVSKTGDFFAKLESLKVTPIGTPAEEVMLNYVKDNTGNQFLWGRRGPSVHMGYELPKGEPTEWFYNEVTVPENNDPIGSYFMANGFGEGYFGMQVNSDKERRVLFSVWSPFHTNNPKEIPDDKRVTLLKKGEGVHGGEFGGEGSGGQSYLRYPWKVGTTCRFLNRARPDGKGSTIYTGWFYVPEKKAWQLIASFKRPNTNTHLTGVHSFLENFNPTMGYHGRGAHYGNQWACNTKGQWHEVTRAQFTGDDIASNRFRLDYAGGVVGQRFFLRNGGFFAENVGLGARFAREATPDRKPVIDFSQLEGVTDGF